MEGARNTKTIPLTIQRTAGIFDRQPDYVMSGGPANLVYAAKWTIPGCSGKFAGPEHILSYHVAGTTSVRKVVGGKTLATHAPLRTVSFTFREEGADWELDGELSAIVIYVHPNLIRHFAQQYSKTGDTLCINPFFATEEPWLNGYFQMLMSEAESSGDPSLNFDSFFLEQSQQLLLRHLVSCHSHLGSPVLRELDNPKTNHALQPFLLKRVLDFVEANLTKDLRLADMVDLVHMSEYHFIRSFHAATGTTPYQFLLEKRLQAGASLLQKDEHSIGEIATLAGFKSASHFAAKFRTHFGLTPTRYRIQAMRSTSNTTPAQP